MSITDLKHSNEQQLKNINAINWNHVETACGDCMFAKCNINQTVELKRLIDEQQVAGRRL